MHSCLVEANANTLAGIKESLAICCHLAKNI